MASLNSEFNSRELLLWAETKLNSSRHAVFPAGKLSVINSASSGRGCVESRESNEPAFLYQVVPLACAFLRLSLSRACHP